MEKYYPESENLNKERNRKPYGKELIKRKEEILKSGDYLKLEDCKEGYLYIIIARHAYVGIYDKKKQAFITNRKKFEENFLWDEDHYDTGEPHGTAIPLEEIEEVPELKTDEEKLEYLAKKAEELKPEIEKLLENKE